jgi:acyl-CoA thioesterase-1
MSPDPNPAFAPPHIDPSLPSVLLIGDSISIGYMLPTRAKLAGKANVFRPAINCGPTIRAPEHLDDWISGGPWAVIHYNFGLHDLKHMNAAGDMVSPDVGHYQVPIEQYEENLGSITDRLAATGAVLIWASTTPVPEGATGRIKSDAARYNEAAKRVADGRGVRINDLYTFALDRLDTIQRPANVHFTEGGSEALAERVAQAILDALPST